MLIDTKNIMKNYAELTKRNREKENEETDPKLLDIATNVLLTASELMFEVGGKEETEKLIAKFFLFAARNENEYRKFMKEVDYEN